MKKIIWLILSTLLIGSGFVQAGIPTVSGVPSDIVLVEDIQSNIDLSAVTFTDGDAGADLLTVLLVASSGTFAVPADGAGDSVVETRLVSNLIQLVGTAANINSYLDTASNIQYTGASNLSGENAATILINANDGETLAVDPVINLDITAANDLPTVSGSPADLTVVEDVESNIDLSAVIFTDGDAGADTVTNTLTASAGTFSEPADGSAVGSGVVETKVDATQITLVGLAADITTYLDTVTHIKYTGASNVSGNDAATITLSATDGLSLASDPVVNLNITAVNDIPTVSTPPSDLDVAEETESNIDLSAATFGDGDEGADTLTVTLVASSGVFSVPVDGGVIENKVGATVITLVGTAADINTYLDTASNIKYTGANAVNGDNAATITISVTDGGSLASDPVVLLIITAVNDIPTVSR